MDLLGYLIVSVDSTVLMGGCLYLWLSEVDSLQVKAGFASSRIDRLTVCQHIARSDSESL